MKTTRKINLVLKFTPEEANQILDRLTSREVKIFKAYVNGASIGQIEEAFGIARSTITAHLARIGMKTNIPKRVWWKLYIHMPEE